MLWAVQRPLCPIFRCVKESGNIWMGSPGRSNHSAKLPHDKHWTWIERCCLVISHVGLFVTPWPVACKAPLLMEFSRQEYWSGLPFHSPFVRPIITHTHKKAVYN